MGKTDPHAEKENDMKREGSPSYRYIKDELHSLTHIPPEKMEEILQFLLPSFKENNMTIAKSQILSLGFEEYTKDSYRLNPENSDFWWILIPETEYASNIGAIEKHSWQYPPIRKEYSIKTFEDLQEAWEHFKSLY